MSIFKSSGINTLLAILQNRVESPFKKDNSVLSDCQMKTGATFKVSPTEESAIGKFQRGHLADANSLDGEAQSIADSFFVTNMLPQAANFNTNDGAWRHSEEIAECYREISTLMIWALRHN